MAKKRLYIAGHTGMVGSALYDYFKQNNRYELLTVPRRVLDLTQQSQTVKWLKENVLFDKAGKPTLTYKNNEGKEIIVKTKEQLTL